MKRLFSVFLLLFVITLSGCGAPENRVTPPFFKVTDEDTGGVAYLLGTMHAGLKNTVYPDTLYAALNECGTLAVEIDLLALDKNASEVAEAMKIMECESAEEYMGADYAEIRARFKELGMYSAAYDRYIPAVWSSVLANRLAADCGYSSDLGTDRELLTYAKKNKLNIVELETAAEQYSVNAAEPPELQMYMLLESVRTDYDIQKRQMNDLYAAWAAGDTDALEAMLTADEPPDELAAQYAVFYSAMYENRQRKMADYIIEVLKEGRKTVVAVGAMHFAAAPDIPDFLEQAGYRVESLNR